MKQFTIYGSRCRENPKNCIYPDKILVTDKQSLARAVQHDYVCAEYKDWQRGNENFIQSDCVCMDCDNDHSDNPGDWVTPESVTAVFPDVDFCVHYSRNNMKKKNGKTGRPKFHVIFAVAPIMNAEEYASIKRQVADIFSYFDRNALDPGRCFFGTEDPEVIIIPGKMTLTDFLSSNHSMATTEPYTSSITKMIIPEGSRNTAMYRIACQLLKRCGPNEDTYKKFLEEAQRCEPPLDQRELDCIWQSALKFYRSKIATNPNYVPPQLYGQLYEPETFRLLPDDLTDVGQAEVLAREYGGELRYSHATGYIVYNGSYWEFSETRAHSKAQELTNRQLDEARSYIVPLEAGLIKSPPHVLQPLMGQIQKAKEYENFVLKRRQTEKIKASLAEARPKLEIDPKDLDAKEFLLNTPSGTYDLRDGLDGRQEHKSTDFITKQTAVDPSEDGKDVWEATLATIFCGNKALIDYVQELIGLASIGKVYNELLLIAYGEGRNGKSTFFNAVMHVLGTYSGSISSEILTTAGVKGNPKNEMAELRGKRLVLANELGDSTRLNTAMVKKLCSTDEIMAEVKYKNPAAFTPTHTLILCTNYLPEVEGLDTGTWRRLSVIPFNAKIEGKSDIKNYAEYLVKNAGGAILSWIIDGARRIIQKGYMLTPPDAVKAATVDYHEESDWASRFVDEYCELGEGYKVKASELYQEYQVFCGNRGEHPKTQKVFGTALSRRFHKNKGKVWEYLGLRLKK